MQFVIKSLICKDFSEYRNHANFTRKYQLFTIQLSPIGGYRIEPIDV